MPEAMIPSRNSSSGTLLPAARDSDTASIRPRNRRYLSAQDDGASSSALSTPSRSPSRGASPIPAAHIGEITGRNNPRAEVVQSTVRAKSPGGSLGLLDGSWTPSWASVQEFASSLLAGGDSQRPGNVHGSKSKKPARPVDHRVDRGKRSWGPESPNERRPRPEDIAAGSLAERESALKAIRTATVLESYDGVNGGLDVAGRFKKRKSDEDLRRASSPSQETEEYLAYIHHVQATDTYAGVVLKYRCREDAFRKANGLWSRDNIQVRKWLAIPVDACEVKGRPCAPPTGPTSKVDLLARTPDTSDPFRQDGPQTHGDYFAGPSNGHPPDQDPTGGDDRPWTHVRWVSIDSCPHPVEVARVPRKALGYFPPRRKKSINTTSAFSTPRVSADLPGVAVSEPAVESPRSNSSRRPSLLSSRGAPASARSRLNSAGSAGTTADNDPRPAWMRRPGGVGSLGRHVRAPGPETDYLNSWTNKHLPGLNIDSLPSMSVMGSESARFGFGRADEEPPVAIVESPFEEGRDAASTVGRQGTGLDKAAAAIETWLRGAFERARQGGPLTPVLGPRGRPSAGGAGGSAVGMSDGGGGGDLIELTDTGSDDGRHESVLWDTEGLLRALPRSSSSGALGGSASRSRSAGEQAAGFRGRRGGAGMGDNKKSE